MKFCYVLGLIFLEFSLIHGNDVNISDVASPNENFSKTLLRTSSSLNTTVLQEQSQRVLSFGQSAVCSPADPQTRDFFETIVIRNTRRNYYLNNRGAVPGSCKDSCEDLCDHKPCYSDYKMVRGDDCQCSKDVPYNCGPNTSCNSTLSQCFCNSGYEGAPESAEGCTDINECANDSLNECGPNTICINTIGSYECFCKQGYAGPQPLGGGCFDIDECSSGICGPFSSQCLNTPGGYQCVCNRGFTWSGSYGTGCVNVNECLQGVCGPGAICTDSVGSFSCRCRNGFRGDPPAVKCTDKDECREREGICGPNSICTNIDNFFTCECLPGYVGNPPLGPNCRQNKCLEAGVLCGANAFCSSTSGKCTCPFGFGGPNVTGGGPCSDIDECAGSNPCPPDAPVCANVVGTFQCLIGSFGQCPDGSNARCVSGVCAKLSRTDNTLVCCDSFEPCSPSSTELCCNGAYGIGEECPSRIAKDCTSPLKCGRRDRSSNTFVCCRDTFTPILDPLPVCQ